MNKNHDLAPDFELSALRDDDLSDFAITAIPDDESRKKSAKSMPPAPAKKTDALASPFELVNPACRVIGEEYLSQEAKKCPYCTNAITLKECIPVATESSVGRYIIKNRSVGHDKYSKFWKSYYGELPTAPKGIYITRQALQEMLDSDCYDVVIECTAEHKIAIEYRDANGSSHYVRISNPACPHCAQFLPSAFWNKECIGIAMFGPSKAGKTAYVTSLVSSGVLDGNPVSCVQLQQLSPGLATLISSTGDLVGANNVINEAVRNWQSGIFPSGTDKLLPPVFLRLKLPPDGRELLVYIVDQPGENTTVDSDMPRYIDQSVGIMYIVEPRQFEAFVHPHVKRQASDCEFGISKDSGDTAVTDLLFVHESGERARLYDPLEVFRKHFDASAKHKDKFCACVMTKLDKLYGDADDELGFSGAVREELDRLKPLLFPTREDNIPAKGKLFDFEKDRWLGSAYEQLFSISGDITLHQMKDTFRRVKYFACSASGVEPHARRAVPYRGERGWEYIDVDAGFEEDEYNPCHVTEPFMWLVYKYLESVNKI